MRPIFIVLVGYIIGIIWGLYFKISIVPFVLLFFIIFNILKKKRYNWGDKFFVMDENDKKKYQVTSSVLLWSKKVEIRDMDKNLLVTLKNDPKSLLKKKFFIFIGDEQKAAITKEMSLMPKYTMEGLDWQMKGVMLHSYEMLKGGQTVLSFQREDSHRFELNYANPADELLALAVVMTVSYAMNMDDGPSGTRH